jgi:hypothetical protein
MRMPRLAIPVALASALLCLGVAAVLLASGCDRTLPPVGPEAYPIASATRTPLWTPTEVSPGSTRDARPSPTVTASRVVDAVSACYLGSRAAHTNPQCDARAYLDAHALADSYAHDTVA